MTDKPEKPAYLARLAALALPSLATVPLMLAKQAGANVAQLPAIDDPGSAQAPSPIELPNRILGPDLYAGHSSHASHSSHSSHSSHYSGSGGYGGYSDSTPSYSSPSSPSTTPPTSSGGASSSTPASRSPTSSPASGSTTTKTAGVGCASLQGAVMGMRAQMALKERKLYFGKIDGVMGPETKAAIMVFQGSQNLPQTGNLDNATLAKLGVVC